MTEEKDTLSFTDEKSSITFWVNKTEWALEISKDGIKFNRELYPESNAEDFAEVFVQVLEKQYDVKFIKKK